MPGRTTRFGLLAGLAVASLIGATSAPAAAASTTIVHHPVHRITHATSTNWAGYDDIGQTYTTVSASWVQPAVTCAAGKTSYSSFWVGLDGDGSNSVEQTGTEADCSHGRAVYSSWFEFFPAFRSIARTRSPGDSFTASATSTGGGNYTLVLTKQHARLVAHHDRVSARRVERVAEVIAEAPSSNRGVLPLANFGSMTFTNAQVNGQPLGNVATTQPLTMVTTGGTVKCSVSSLSGGTTFTASWHHA